MSREERTSRDKKLFSAKVGIAHAHHDNGVACVSREVVVPEVADEILGFVLDARCTGRADLREGCDVRVSIFRIRDVRGDIDVYDAVAGRGGPFDVGKNAVGLWIC